MKLVCYSTPERRDRLGLLVDSDVVDLADGSRSLSRSLPATMAEFLAKSAENLDLARELEAAHRKAPLPQALALSQVTLLSPVPHPPSCRDAYAFRQHVATARRNRGVEMIPEFDQFPVFYFTNHNAIIGPGELVVESDHQLKLDFELEIAAVLGKGGRNIAARDADGHILGLTIMNDFSARVLQMEEMKLNLGPAKGKDFATALGPFLITMDELAPHKIATPDGDKYDLEMTAHHNGKQISLGNMKDMDWTFAEIIERASYGVEMFPGDVIGSGTVGTGCYLELNGTWALEAKAEGRDFTPVWLEVGDKIDLTVTALGTLSHTIVAAPEARSILAKKKQ